MVALKNDRYLRALAGQAVDYTPVWMMRQAGRYLPEYRAIRASVGGFMQLCKNPQLACEVTVQPLRRFPLDAAILFSDILTIPDAMGLGLYFTAGEGPRFERPLRTEQAIRQLAIPDPETELRYVMDTVRAVHQSLQGDVPLIGFSGSPWTLATYMIEGGPSKNYAIIKQMLYSQPALLHQLLDKLAQSVTHYLNGQIRAGVDAIMLFDTWGGVLSTESYQQFSLRYMQQIIAGLTASPTGAKVPVTLFTKGGGQWLAMMKQAGSQAIGLDWTTPIGVARAQVGEQITLQGNLDPCVLYADEATIEREVAKILADYGQGHRHIFNLGHGIHPDVQPEKVAFFIDTVHRLSAPYHQSC